MSTTAPEAVIAALPGLRTPAVLPFWRRAMVFGTGFGIAIRERDLEAAIVRARPSGPTLIRTATIADFRNRPAAEWGAELLQFVAAAGERRLAATVLLPRTEVIVRSVSLPGVADKDAAAAIELQIDTLHPWGDVEIAWGWSRAGHGALKGDVMIGLVRKELLGSYETLFAEAGILMAAATFSSAVIHSALRIWSAAAPLLFFASDDDGGGRTEIYGESESRSVFSAEFSVPRERAIALARAELRMPPDSLASPLSDVLPLAPGVGFPGSGVGAGGSASAWSTSGLSYAAALAGSAPLVASFANLLPAERRASHDRVQYLVPAILGILLALALLTVFVIFPAIEQRRYRNDLERAARQLQPAALRAQALERNIAADRNKILSLDEIRRRPQSDLEVLNELTRLLPPPIWTSAASRILSGLGSDIGRSADQAAPLLKVIDSSPLFQDSEFSFIGGAQ